MHRAVLALASCTAVVACESATNGDVDAWLVASVRGAAEMNYEGTGEFLVTSDWRAGYQTVFQLLSEGTGSSEGQRVLVYGVAPAPSVGRYPLVESARVHEMGSGFTAYYFPTPHGEPGSYVAVNGELEITHSSAERVEGQLRFTALAYCLKPGATASPEVPCGSAQVDRLGTSIQLIGSFAATQKPRPTATPF